MTETDAYEHAITLFGPQAGVWRAASDRHIVGRWVVLSELTEPERGLFAGAGAVILRTRAKGMQVLGEGSTWAKAFMSAEAWAKPVKSGGTVVAYAMGRD